MSGRTFFCSKQPVNSPGTACTGSGSVMWLRHKAELMSGDNKWYHNKEELIWPNQDRTRITYRRTGNIRRTLVDNRIVRSLRCSWNIACRRYSTYIFNPDLTPGSNWLAKDNCKTRRKTLNVLIFGASYIRDLTSYACILCALWWFTRYYHFLCVISNFCQSPDLQWNLSITII